MKPFYSSIRRDIRVFLFFFFIFGLFSFTWASLEERRVIHELPLSDNKNIELLSRLLMQENILNLFTIREKLLSLSYEDLLILRKKICNNTHTKILDTFSLGILAKMEGEGIFLLPEDVFINNQPQFVDTPFYPHRLDNYSITQLKPYAEYLYFDNLKLIYTPRQLLQKDEELWCNPVIKGVQASMTGSLSLDNNNFPQWQMSSFRKEAGPIWSYELYKDNLSAYLFDHRVWLKKYIENEMRPVFYGDTIILNNKHRIFCIDSISKTVIWSLSEIEQTGEEYYQTCYPIHQNGYGYEFLIADDMLFSECNGKLIAAELKDFLNPRVVWERDLGEYRICSRPVKNGIVLVVGLINLRKEIWFCGFNCLNGKLEWSTYIGTSSFDAPACEISTQKNNRVFIGTNHGFFACLNSINGEIVWIRKYKSKNYSVFDYYVKKIHLDELANKGTIPFDTQFIELSQEGVLYYKPRESDYLYVINSDNGILKEKILIDSDSYYILRAYAGKAVFFKKPSLNNKARLIIVDLASGNNVFVESIEGNSLCGVFSNNTYETIFKIDDTVHFLFDEHNKISHKEIKTGAGWLLNQKNRFILVGEDRTLFSFDMLNESNLCFKEKNLVTEGIKKQQEIQDALFQILQGRMDSAKKKALIDDLQALISSAKLQPETIIELVVRNKEKIKDSCWNDFFSALEVMYGGTIIAYKDIKMRFSSFLSEEKLIKRKVENPNTFKKNIFKQDSSKNNYAAHGDRLFLLPFEVIRGDKLQNFFLLLNYDQLLCVREDGIILWTRKIFVPIFKKSISYDSDREIGSFDVDGIKAYLYNNILIINDYRNIVAIDVNDGSYVWSMTNQNDYLNKWKKDLNLLDKNKSDKYGVHASVARSVMFQSVFLNDKLMVINENKLYALNPKTGYCYRFRQLDKEEAIISIVSKDALWILPMSMDHLMGFDKDLKLLNDFRLEFLQEKKIYPKLLFLKNNIVIATASRFYLLNNKNGKLTDEIMRNTSLQYCIENCGNRLLVIMPLQSVESYVVEENKLKLEWRFEQKDADLDISQKGIEKKTRYYYLINDSILVPIRKQGKYFMCCIEMKSGNLRWEQPLGHENKLFQHLSFYQKVNSNILFVFSTIYDPHLQTKNKFFYFADIDSTLFCLALSDGKIYKRIDFPLFIVDGFRKSTITQTKGYLIYIMNQYLLKTIKKDEI